MGACQSDCGAGEAPVPAGLCQQQRSSADACGQHFGSNAGDLPNTPLKLHAQRRLMRAGQRWPSGADIQNPLLGAAGGSPSSSPSRSTHSKRSLRSRSSHGGWRAHARGGAPADVIAPPSLHESRMAVASALSKLQSLEKKTADRCRKLSTVLARSASLQTVEQWDESAREMVVRLLDEVETACMLPQIDEPTIEAMIGVNAAAMVELESATNLGQPAGPWSGLSPARKAAAPCRMPCDDSTASASRERAAGWRARPSPSPRKRPSPGPSPRLGVDLTAYDSAPASPAMSTGGGVERPTGLSTGHSVKSSSAHPPPQPCPIPAC